MTVADLIRDLAGLPPDAPVAIADEVSGFIQHYALDAVKLVIGEGECPRCDGYGYDDWADEMDDCPRCDGSGTVESTPRAYLMLGSPSGTALSYREIQEG